VILGVVVLVALLLRLGTGPFLDGLRHADAPLLALALVIGAVTTVCSAWRWRMASAALGSPLSLRTAVASSYRAQLLNSTLPGGVLGDVHRGVRHGVDSGDVGRGLRGVLWDRTSGQAVQVALTAVVLLLLPSPVSPWAVAAVGLLAVGLGALVLDVARRRGSRLGAAARTAVGDLRALARNDSWPVVVVASTGAVSGYVVLLLVAADAVGVDAPVAHLVPLALLMLLAMSVPANVAGWGPREGIAAWSFAAAGLGASAGVSVAVLYGVMSLVATLPGVLVLLGSWRRRPTPSLPQSPTVVPLEGAHHG
jgi:uncharacterized membrane protein YbhN (UPF0104 family)